eukprot:CAMPEP_0175080660 /NCGR_PEP_ID=MMETSP0052_2-20121109/25648_1 /TAXON_ID=51329 ORGANISM="Polytomella parva, Strain SAG 63-3" /NCGR_SAMPLE_ID=MMETSP0052_2 /ASSEMBLY_ACC=CAM_ASM_000194 /LENGTH=356 /DNA_ID=CAMNT_0016351419 /DNA_START=1076 /DNA_END=2142 /DNA_ORIENTATION=-
MASHAWFQVITVAIFVLYPTRVYQMVWVTGGGIILQLVLMVGLHHVIDSAARASDQALATVGVDVEGYDTDEGDANKRGEAVGVISAGDRKSNGVAVVASASSGREGLPTPTVPSSHITSSRVLAEALAQNAKSAEDLLEEQIEVELSALRKWPLSFFTGKVCMWTSYVIFTANSLSMTLSLYYLCNYQHQMFGDKDVAKRQETWIPVFFANFFFMVWHGAVVGPAMTAAHCACWRSPTHLHAHIKRYKKVVEEEEGGIGGWVTKLLQKTFQRRRYLALRERKRREAGHGKPGKVGKNGKAGHNNQHGHGHGHGHSSPHRQSPSAKYMIHGHESATPSNATIKKIFENKSEFAAFA